MVPCGVSDPSSLHMGTMCSGLHSHGSEHICSNGWSTTGAFLAWLGLNFLMVLFSQEKNRIEEHGGVVQRTKDDRSFEPCGPYRVFRKFEDTKPADGPGLAMSRSLGDLCAHRIGVIEVPSIECRPVTSDDCFLVWRMPSCPRFLCKEVSAGVGPCLCLFKTGLYRHRACKTPSRGACSSAPLCGALTTKITLILLPAPPCSWQ
jgi:hypothetical protein